MAILSSPRLQYEDIDGDPYAGGLLYTYDAGTTTPKTVYGDSALTVALSNPVVADATGTFPAIYYSGTAKLTLHTSADVLVWTTDNVTAGGGISSLCEDPAPKLCGDLNTNGRYFKVGSNETLSFTDNTSAVNYIDLANAASGSGSTISAVGDDGDVDLNVNAKGSGNIKTNRPIIATDEVIADGISTGGKVTLREPNANGEHGVSLQAPASVAADYTMILPADIGTSGQVLTTDGVDTTSWTSATPGIILQREVTVLTGYQLITVSGSGGTGGINPDNTPTSTLGAMIMEVDITPKVIGSTLIIRANYLPSGAGSVNWGTIVNQTAGTVLQMFASDGGHSEGILTSPSAYMTTTSLSEVKIQLRSNDEGKTQQNVNGAGASGTNSWGNAATSWLEVVEINVS